MNDGIEKHIVLNAPIDRVWAALTDYREFSAWFRVDLENPFALGEITSGLTTYPGYEGMRFWLRPEQMDAPGYFRFTWPLDEKVAPDDPDVADKCTTVEFWLEQTPQGTRLTMKESGFAKLPEDLGMQMLKRNEGGWELQMKNIREHVESQD